MQPRQRDRIPPVGLDPLTRTLRDQSRGDHHTVVAQSLELTVQPIPGRTRFKAKMQPTIPARQFLDRPFDRSLTVLDLAEKPNLPCPAAFGDRDRMLNLGNIERDRKSTRLNSSHSQISYA